MVLISIRTYCTAFVNAPLRSFRCHRRPLKNSRDGPTQEAPFVRFLTRGFSSPGRTEEDIFHINKRSLLSLPRVRFLRRGSFFGTIIDRTRYLSAQGETWQVVASSYAGG